MFEKLILKQILIFNLEAKLKNTKNKLEKVSIAIYIEKIRKEEIE